MNILEKTAVIIPAYNAQATIGHVVTDIVDLFDHNATRVFVVDDGSSDSTGSEVRKAGAQLIAHASNRGKGAALRTGFEAAFKQGFVCAVTLDADGQHPADQALKLAQHPCSADDLVLGIRDLKTAGAPKPNQFSNGISNYFLSRFASMPLQDTQCGLRRYPLEKTLALKGRSNGFAYEAEVILLARSAAVHIVQVPIHVRYEPSRTTHFDSVRDPAKMIARVLWTVGRGVMNRKQSLQRSEQKI